MVDFLVLDDLTAFSPDIDLAKAGQMIVDATALAVVAAPCLGTGDPVLTATQHAAVKAILRGAILRWDEAGTGAYQAVQVGQVGQTFYSPTQRRGLFWPSELAQLQDICGGTPSSGAFGIDTTPDGYLLVHADNCSLNFGAVYCSCGAVLTQGLPLW